MKWSDDDEKQPGQFEPEGVYPFEVVDSEERVSQKGNAYINVKLLVYVGDSERTLFDNLMPQMPQKLRTFCECTGMADKYKNKTLSADDCLHKQAYLRLTKKPNDKGYFEVDHYLDRSPPKAKGDDMQERVGVTNPGTGPIERMQETDDDTPF